MTAVLLSASVPDRPPFAADCDPLLVREAVLALVSIVTPQSELVFGGHPAISPLVEHAARSLGTLNRVHIFQSEHFAEKMPAVARQFQNLRLTRRGTDRNSSLTLMRNEMIGFRSFRYAVLIGGMEGLFEELELFCSTHPSGSVIPVASTGGAARSIFDSGAGPRGAKDRVDLESSLRYRGLFRRLLAT
jgi:hypothetical protein